MGNVPYLKKLCNQRCLFALSLVFLLVTISKWIVSFSYHSRQETSSKYGLTKGNSRPVFYIQTRKFMDEHREQYDVMFLFDNALNDQRLQTNFKNCISSVLSKASRPLRIHIAGDESSFQIAQELLQNISHNNVYSTVNTTMIHLDKNKIQSYVAESISLIHQHISGKNHQFSDSLFYLSILMHKIMPHDTHRMIVLDIDLVILSDIIDLFSLFDSFNSEQVVGIARENQPVYRHVFWEFRSKHNNTRVGEPPPNGLTGFNSGVLLLHLDNMRFSSTYNSFLSDKKLTAELVKKYKFQGDLGDQDFFTLLSLEHEELFYILPCGWNRQLCTWWKRDDFVSLFDHYFQCHGPIHILHGNCKTSLKNYSLELL